jgi:surface antigen
MNTLQRLVIPATAALVLSVGVTRAQAQCTNQSTGGSEIIGTLLGAALGGLLGSRIGSGTGHKVAIGAGVLAGGLFGNRVGSKMDCHDQGDHKRTAQSALENQKMGATSSWANPDSGHSGSVTPTRTWQRDDGRYCREFEQTVQIDGRSERATGIACRQDDGTWRMESS